MKNFNNNVKLGGFEVIVYQNIDKMPYFLIDSMKWKKKEDDLYKPRISIKKMEIRTLTVCTVAYRSMTL